MKLVRELTKFFDARLLLIATITVIFGFGIAHWNGLRVAADSPGEGLSASIAYEVGFGQAAWTIQLIVIAAALVAGLATIVGSINSKRLAVQLGLTTVIFAVLNLTVLAFRASGI